MKNLFKTKFDVAVIVLIPACIGINYLGKLFASVLKLPLWLDSIGTCIDAWVVPLSEQSAEQLIT